MTLAGLVDLFCTEPTIVQTIDDARARRPSVLDVTAPLPMRPLDRRRGERVTGARRGAIVRCCWSRSTFREAEELTAALQSLVGEEAGGLLPGVGDPAARATEPRSDTVGRRLAVLRRLAGNSSTLRRRGSSSLRSAASSSRR